MNFSSEFEESAASGFARGPLFELEPFARPQRYRLDGAFSQLTRDTNQGNCGDLYVWLNLMLSDF